MDDKVVERMKKILLDDGLIRVDGLAAYSLEDGSPLKIIEKKGVEDDRVYTRIHKGMLAVTLPGGWILMGGSGPLHCTVSYLENLAAWAGKGYAEADEFPLPIGARIRMEDLLARNADPEYEPFSRVNFRPEDGPEP